MHQGIILIVGITTVAFGSMFAGSLLEGAGKMTEARLADITGKGLIVATVAGTLGKALSAILKLG